MSAKCANFEVSVSEFLMKSRVSKF